MTTLLDPEAAAPVASLIAFFRKLTDSPHTEFARQPGLVRYRTAVPHSWFNGVLVSRAPDGDESATIQEQVEYFRLRGVQAFTWWLEPELSIDDWAKRLQPHGFTLNYQPPGMVCELDRLPGSVPAPAEFEIRQVNDLPGLGVWVSTFVDGYGLPVELSQPFYDLLSSIDLSGDLQHYLGILDGKPVAAASIFYSDGIAGIYNVGVAKSARGRGLGSAITLKPLQDARQQGYTLGALQSSEMGFSVYQQLGFRKVCDVRHFSIGLE